MPPPPPKIQFWNDYPGRATLRSWDHKIYMLGANGPVGPLGITDEKGSYSLSRRPNEDVNDKINHLNGDSMEPSSLWLMGIRETILLNVLKDGNVITQEVAEHGESKVNHFDHERYRPEDPEYPKYTQYCLDYTRAKHRRISPVDARLTILKNQKGHLVEDAETVVAANWYVLVLTRSGDLYFNQDLYMENVQSIAAASTREFVLVLKKPHRHEFHCNFYITWYLKSQDNHNGKDDIGELRSHGSNSGLRDSSLPVVGRSVYYGNLVGHIYLKADGRLETDFHIPPELKTRLTDESNYVKNVAVSPFHFTALLQLDNENQEVYVWGGQRAHAFGWQTPVISERVDFKMHPCFVEENPENGRAVRKRVVDITVSDSKNYNTDSIRGYRDYFVRDRRRIDYKNVIALNFEDNSSCLLLISDNLSYLTSFSSEHTRSIYNTADGVLIVTDSKIFKMTEAGQSLNIVTDSRRRYASFVASLDGYVIVYPNGEFVASESVRPPFDIEDMIRQGNGITEIHHDRSGTFHAILRNGTFVSWYSETSVIFRSTPKWDMDKSLSLSLSDHLLLKSPQ